MAILLEYVFAVTGLVLLLYFAERLIHYCVLIAHNYRISPATIGMTIIAIGTSLPEIVVAIISASSGLSGISFGNIIGSNIANIAMVLAVAVLIKPFHFNDSHFLKHLYLLIAISALLIFALYGNTISRMEGAIMLTLMVAILCYQIKTADKSADESQEVNQSIALNTTAKIGLWLKVGLLLLFVYLSSQLFIFSLENIGNHYKIPEIVIGLTVVAIGTSLPELVTVVMAAIKRQNAMALGNIIGSNLYNILAGLGFATVISPIQLDQHNFIRDYGLMLLVTFALAIPFIVKRVCKQQSAYFGRIFGSVLLVSYIGYMALVVWTK